MTLCVHPVVRPFQAFGAFCITYRPEIQGRLYPAGIHRYMARCHVYAFLSAFDTIPVVIVAGSEHPANGHIDLLHALAWYFLRLFLQPLHAHSLC